MTESLWLIRISLLSLMIFGNTQSMDGNSKVPSKRTIETCKSSTILITYDNNPHDARLNTLWGFSCLVRCDQKTILFDTGGNSAILLDNMKKLQIDPKEIDIVVLSHIHGDHTGGLAGFLKKNNQVTVYIPISFPKSFKNEAKRYGASIEEVSASREIMPGVYTTGELGSAIKEQSLIVKTSKGMVIITGCAHPGVVGIVGASKEILNDNVYLVLGGFHLGGTSTSQIKSVIKNLERLGVEKVAPCHCSGEEARSLFQKSFAKNYMKAGVGMKISIL